MIGLLTNHRATVALRDSRLVLLCDVHVKMHALRKSIQFTTFLCSWVPVKRFVDAVVISLFSQR